MLAIRICENEIININNNIISYYLLHRIIVRSRSCKQFFI